MAPFIVNRPLAADEPIFGRDALLRAIAASINAGSSVNLVGEESMGKSSVLNHLCTPGGLLFSHNAAPLAVAYIRLREQTVGDVNGFYRAAAQQWLAALPAQRRREAAIAELTAACAARTLQEHDASTLLDAIGQSHMPLLVVDDFEVLLRDGAAQQFRFPGFFDALGEHVTQQRIIVVLTSRLALARYCTERRDRLTSSFYRSFIVERVEPLTKDAAEQLLLQSGTPTLRNEQARLAYEWASGNPRNLQIAGMVMQRATVENQPMTWTLAQYAQQVDPAPAEPAGATRAARPWWHPLRLLRGLWRGPLALVALVKWLMTQVSNLQALILVVLLIGVMILYMTGHLAPETMRQQFCNTFGLTCQ